MPAIAGSAKRPPHRVIDKHRAWRGDFGHNVKGRADNQGRDAMAFDHVGDETDGLMAERSIRHEERNLDPGLL